MSASYFSILRLFGYSEPKLWLQALAQPVFLQLLQGMQTVLAGVAAVPSARASFPALQGNITLGTALAQWATCSVTGGFSLLQLPNGDAIKAARSSPFLRVQALSLLPHSLSFCPQEDSLGRAAALGCSLAAQAFPYQVEYCGWARSIGAPPLPPAAGRPPPSVPRS